MKHIGWCLDRIQIVMSSIPKALESQKEMNRATNILYEVKVIGDVLAKLIQNSKFKRDLHELENNPVKEVRLEAHEIEELIKDLEHMLYVLNLYINELTEIINHRPGEWSKKADQLVLMIDQKFGGERGELRRVFQIELDREEELERLVKTTKSMANFLKK